MKVPVPSIGRVVFFGEPGYKGEPMTIRPAIVLVVDSQQPEFVDLRVIDEKDSDAGGLYRLRVVRYGEGKENCWWWPPRVEGVMEVGS